MINSPSSRPPCSHKHTLELALLALLALLFSPGCMEPDQSDHRRLNTLEQPTLITDLPRLSGDYPAELIDGLSAQLVAEVNCIQPGVLVPFEVREELGYLFTDNYIPHMLRPEVLAAAKAVAAGQNDFMTITSGYRDVGMQYYDWLWGQELGFMAARPGSSRHQAGQAIDVRSHDYWRPFLIDYGWSWPYGTNDAPHFEWIENNTPDLMVESVRAFQRLWNRNNTGDFIDEDGAWGPVTEARMATVHAYGFPYGGCDLDLDGHADTIIGGDDCDDTAADVHPGATEICGDNIDQDCSGADLGCGEDPGPTDTSLPDTNQPDTWIAPTDTMVGQDTTVVGQDTTVVGQDTTVVGQDTTVVGQDTTVVEQDTNTTADGTTTPDTTTGETNESLAVWQEAPVDGMQTETACGCQTTRPARGWGATPWFLLVMGGVIAIRRQREKS